jgi:hypothetical protein
VDTAGHHLIIGRILIFAKVYLMPTLASQEIVTLRISGEGPGEVSAVSLQQQVSVFEADV